MKLLRMMTVLSVVLLAAGCAATGSMRVAEDQSIDEPQPDDSQMVFLRSSLVGSAHDGSLYEVTDDGIEFIGIIGNGWKLVHDTSPGRHVFMVVSEAADFMEAETVAGKRYHALVTPRTGVWSVRFSLWPISTDPGSAYTTESGDFDAWMRDTTLMETTDDARQWYRDNRESIEDKYERYWQKWVERPAEERARRTLVPEDGV